MVDKNDAPEGFYAVKATMLCGGCKLSKKDKCLSIPDANCCRSQRVDGELVIFKRLEQETP